MGLLFISLHLNRTQIKNISNGLLRCMAFHHLPTSILWTNWSLFICECNHLQGWGKTVVLGVDHPEAMLKFSSFEVLHSGKSLMGSLFGGLKPKSDIKILEKRYKHKVNRILSLTFEFKPKKNSWNLDSRSVWFDKI